MYKILIVEDDANISCIIRDKLIKWGYEAQCAKDFRDILPEFASGSPHLVLLDINLPYYDGFYWCEKIRQVSKAPIIFISSRESEADKIRAMAQGGDDYIEKPFSLDLLTAKVQAVLRRAYSYMDDALNVLEYNGIVLNTENSDVFYDRQSMRLTRNECKILALLMRNPDRVVSRARLMKMLWDDESFVDENTLTVNINRLRKKLSELGLENTVETVKGEGYRLA